MTRRYASGAPGRFDGPDLTPRPPLPRGEEEPESESELYSLPSGRLVTLALPASGRVAEGRERVWGPQTSPPVPLSHRRGGARQHQRLRIREPAATRQNLAGDLFGRASIRLDEDVFERIAVHLLRQLSRSQQMPLAAGPCLALRDAAL